MTAMLKNAIYYTLIIISALIPVTSCQDDFFNDINGFNGDGTGGVTLLVDFQPLAGADIKSRAINHMTGDMISGIQDMCIVIFDENGGYVDMIDVKDGMYKDDSFERNDSDASNGQLAGETSTIRREIYLQKISNGKFYIYAVSNLGQYSATDGIVKSTREYLEEIGVSGMSRSSFRTMRRTWDPSNFRNNCEMSGYFTVNEQSGSTVGTGVEETPVNIYPGVSLHCWLRRLASKVTVDFDASGLNPSTTVFIKEIRVRDIPYDCMLVAPNIPTADVDKTGGLMSNSRSTHGIQTCVDLNADPLSSHAADWLALTSGCPTIDDFVATTTNAALKAQLANISHANTAKSIFFYENMQGDGESKRQDAEGGGFEKDENGNDIPLPDGIIDSPNSTDPDDPVDGAHYKDGKPAGTYVEVIGYYESYDQGNEGSGNIIYRFMLGKDAESNYDVERNHHYKLTLCFRGYANDYDWHIEYDRAQPPVTIPDEYYISYGYNAETELPIKVSGEIVDNIVTVEIVRNDWFPSNIWEDSRPSKMGIVEGGIYMDPDHVDKANGAEDPKNLSVGFLSLRKTHASAAGTGKDLAYIHDLWMGGGDKSIDDYVRDEYTGDEIYSLNVVPERFRKKRPLGFRAYKFDGIDGAFSGDKVYDSRGDMDTADGSYRLWTKAGTNNVPRQTTVYIPLFTRNRNLVKTTGYTGNNPYNVFQRRAAIRIRFKVRDQHGNVTDIDKTVPIIQATKLANPMGIWREWNNAAPFDVHLKYLNGREAETYSVLTSKSGGWSAEVEQGSDWILLNGGKRKVYGGENSEIRFTYRPAGILSGPNQTRCGIITVRYHNYSCVHKIFVRQGYAPIKVLDGGPYWHTANLVTANSEGIEPTDEGSLFKYGNLDQPIDAMNNVNDESPWLVIKPNMWKDHTNTDLVIAGKAGSADSPKKWGQISSSSPMGGGSWSASITLADGNKARLPKIKEVVDLRDNSSTAYHFGVLYGDDATMTGDNIDQAYRFKAGDKSTHTYGMRGCFVYNLNNANQIFLPIGSSGYGLRKEGRKTTITAGNVELSYGWGTREVGRGIVRYASSRISYIPEAQAVALPLLYDIFKSYGANYWCFDYVADDPYGIVNGEISKRSAIDFNYNTFDFFTLGTEPFTSMTGATVVAGYGSDALFIRLVQDTAP